MDMLVLIIFLLTYMGMALGRVPGLRLDRTGIALLGMVALLGSGTVELAHLGQAVDMSTLLLLFALMIISSQFQAAGFYGHIASRLGMAAMSPRRLLFLVIIIAGGLSAVLANDIVVFAITPILADGIARRGLDPRPFLLGLAGGANAGSAMTVIGNPQNILIGQTGNLNFWSFLWACGPAALASLLVVFACLCLTWHRQLQAVPQPTETAAIITADPWQTGKGVIAILIMLLLFASGMPKEIGALIIAGCLLMSRRLASRDMIGAVDWHLLVLFACLFIITDAFSSTHFAALGVEWLAESGWRPENLAHLLPMSLLSSNTIGNVPAIMLCLSVWPLSDKGVLYGLALLSTLAGNFLLVGSLANIIVAERSALAGYRLSFMDFARAGIPMTLLSMLLATLWLWLGGWMPLQ